MLTLRRRAASLTLVALLAACGGEDRRRAREAKREPLAPDLALTLRAPSPKPRRCGIASYYHPSLDGGLTANGERYDESALTAAHKSLPFGALLTVTRPETGAAVTVRINDRGPFVAGRSLDLSRAAAARIGLVGEDGVADVCWRLRG